MRSPRLPLIFSMVVAGALLVAPGAGAASITLGANLSDPFPISNLCGSGCTVAYFSLAGPGGLPASPIDGAITSWSVKGASATPGFALRTLTKSGASFTGVATSAPQTPATKGIETFPVAMPIRKGEYIGINIPSGANLGQREEGGFHAYYQPALADGATQVAAEYPGELAFSAQVQPPPTVTTFNPTATTIAGGTAVTILGTDFENATEVRFGSTPAAGFTINSEDAITATAPASGAGGFSVFVTTPAGTAASSQAFTYTAPASAPPATGVPPSPVAPPASVVPARCTVPKLAGKKLRAARKGLSKSDCKLGTVKKVDGATAKTGKVTNQSPKPGKVLAAGSKVAVKLG
jgi:hypothetical protein